MSNREFVEYICVRVGKVRDGRSGVEYVFNDLACYESRFGDVIREYVRHSSATRWLHLVSGTVYFTAAGMLGLRR